MGFLNRGGDRVHDSNRSILRFDCLQGNLERGNRERLADSACRVIGHLEYNWVYSTSAARKIRFQASFQARRAVMKIYPHWLFLVPLAVLMVVSPVGAQEELRRRTGDATPEGQARPAEIQQAEVQEA
jgi:hypothetical protein